MSTMAEAALKSPLTVHDDRAFGHLTLKQKAFVMHYLDTGGNATEAVKRAGYQVKDDHVAAEIGYENLRKPEIHRAVQALLESYNLNADAMGLKLFEGLNATRTHFFAHEGQVISEREVVDFKSRAVYLDMAYRLLGSYKQSAAMPAGGWPGPVIYLPEKQPL